MRKLQDYIFLYLKGICISAANLIPGVSAGTFAFISGIYEELIYTLRMLDRTAFQLLVNARMGEFWKKINGIFLLVLIAGIITGTLTLTRLVTAFFVDYSIHIWSFFFGLILISSPLILRSIRRWSVTIVLALLVGIAGVLGITLLSPGNTPEGLWFIFIVGAIASFGILIPGVSGIFILLLLSKYEYIVRAFQEFNLAVIITFVTGCLLGLLTLARAMNSIMQRYHAATMALLTGCMIGSLYKLWPWKYVLSYRIDSEGNQTPAFDRSILPGEYLEKTGKNPEVIQAILWMALGVFIVILIDKVATRLKTKI